MTVTGMMMKEGRSSSELREKEVLRQAQEGQKVLIPANSLTCNKCFKPAFFHLFYPLSPLTLINIKARLVNRYCRRVRIFS